MQSLGLPFLFTYTAVLRLKVLCSHNLSHGFLPSHWLPAYPLELHQLWELDAFHKMMALLAHLMSTHNLTSPLFGLWNHHNGFTQGIGPSTCSIMSTRSNSSSFFSIFSFKLNAVGREGCATGSACSSMCSFSLKSFNFPIPVKTSLNLVVSSLWSTRATQFNGTCNFKTPNSRADSLPSNGSPALWRHLL